MGIISIIHNGMTLLAARKRGRRLWNVVTNKEVTLIVMRLTCR